jgi:hypothetical protein
MNMESARTGIRRFPGRLTLRPAWRPRPCHGRQHCRGHDTGGNYDSRIIHRARLQVRRLMPSASRWRPRGGRPFVAPLGCLRARTSVSGRSVTGSGWSASWITIWGTSTTRRVGSSRPRIPSAREAYPCLRNGPNSMVRNTCRTLPLTDEIGAKTAGFKRTAVSSSASSPKMSSRTSTPSWTPFCGRSAIGMEYCADGAVTPGTVGGAEKAMRQIATRY